MAGFSETLKKKQGPLPVWAWVLIGVIVLAILMSMRKKKSATSSQDTSGDSSLNSSGSQLGVSPADITQLAGPMPYQAGDTFLTLDQNLPTGNITQTTTVNPTPPPVPTQTTSTPARPYKGAQWNAGQKVRIGGTPGVADTWQILASKILSSNTVNKEGTDYVSGAASAHNIQVATAALKAANPALAKKYPTAVPNTNTIVIPYIPGLNWGKTTPVPAGGFKAGGG